MTTHLPHPPASTGSAQAALPVTVPALGRVAVVGLGYVGLPTALGLHEAGVQVIGIDRDPRRISDIRTGAVDLIEDDRVRLQYSLSNPGFEMTQDAARLTEADAVMICTPTPVDRHRVPDLSSLRDACADVLRHVRPGQTLLLTSTSFVGTASELLVRPLTEEGWVVGQDVFVASCPERIDPGNERFTQRETPRVLGGATPACTAMAHRVIERLAPRVHVVPSAEAAEMTKLYENSFRAVNIALANEFAEICGRLNLDPIPIVEAAASKPFGFMPFRPGPGVGGHCIPCDPHYLLWQLRASGGSAPLLTEAMTAIDERPGQVVDRVLRTLSGQGKGLTGTRVVVVGVTYKPGVRDVRSSSALEIIDLLSAQGAKVGYVDPLIPELRLLDGSTLTGSVQPHGVDWDIALIHTLQPEADHDWISACPMVVDASYSFTPGPSGTTHR